MSEIGRACRRGRTVLLVTLVCLVGASPIFSQAQQRTAKQHAEQGRKLAKAGDLPAAETEFRRAVELAPQRPDYLADLAITLSMEHKLEESSGFLAKALQVNSANLNLRGVLAANQWQLGQLEDARKNLEIILREEPGDEAARLLRGMVAENLKDYGPAVRWLSSVPALVKQRPESVLALAHSYYETGEQAKARATLNDLVDPPRGSKVIFLGGQVAAQARDYEMAERFFASIRLTYPDRARVGYNLALAQYDGNRFVASERTLRELISAGYETSEIYNLLGWCLRNQPDLNEAVRAFEEAIRREPRRESNYLDLGMVLADGQFYQAALDVANRGEALLPESKHLAMFKGLIEVNLKHFDQAMASYTRAAQLDPTDPEPVLNLAVTQFAAGKTREAFATFERSIREFPRDAHLYQKYGTTLLKYSAAGNPAAEARAVSLLHTAITLDGSLAEPHHQLGNLAMKKGQMEVALEQLQIAGKLNPAASEVHYALAHAYQRLGRGQDAARELELYRRIKSEADRSPSILSRTEMRHE